tara:strand:+ start:1905 stop:3404 length:1500 start_codon:yes stop_codon:yes gene_type:complete
LKYKNKIITEVLTSEQMYRADFLASKNGISSYQLMRNAGKRIAREIIKKHQKGRVLILCGRGNNGGDGFVVARLLSARGWPVQVGILKSLKKMKDDALRASEEWEGVTFELSLPQLKKRINGCSVVVDALFGIGLNRPVKENIKGLINAINKSEIPCVSIDIPSGIDADSGKILGTAIKANETISFFRPKLGHILFPGREYSGNLIISDIGIPDSVIQKIKPTIFLNSPKLWNKKFPWPSYQDHKYSRGHALVMGGEEMTGAARLAARACLRIGSGLVTIAANKSSSKIYKMEMPEILSVTVDSLHDLKKIISDKRKNVFLVGPGIGVSRLSSKKVLLLLSKKRPCVLDADAISAFKDSPKKLFKSVFPRCVLTPHEGEFARLFPKIAKRKNINKVAKCVLAAFDANGVVLLKGSDTVISRPDGLSVVNCNAPPTLATAGSGDVLAGIITGLIAQGMNSFDASVSGAWIHGEAAKLFGPGLVADDLPNLIPLVLKKIDG